MGRHRGASRPRLLVAVDNRVFARTRRRPRSCEACTPLVVQGFESKGVRHLYSSTVWYSPVSCSAFVMFPSYSTPAFNSKLCRFAFIPRFWIGPDTPYAINSIPGMKQFFFFFAVFRFLSCSWCWMAEDARRRKARRGVQLPVVPPHGSRHVLVCAHVAWVRRHGSHQGTSPTEQRKRRCFEELPRTINSSDSRCPCVYSNSCFPAS